MINRDKYKILPLIFLVFLDQAKNCYRYNHPGMLLYKRISVKDSYQLGQIYSFGSWRDNMRLAFLWAVLYIEDMAKKNNYNRSAAEQGGRKEYLKHICGECTRCTPVMKFHTLTIKDRQPTLGRCPECEFCVLLSQQACPKFSATHPTGGMWLSYPTPQTKPSGCHNGLSGGCTELVTDCHRIVWLFHVRFIGHLPVWLSAGKKRSLQDGSITSLNGYCR